MADEKNDKTLDPIPAPPATTPEPPKSPEPAPEHKPEPTKPVVSTPTPPAPKPPAPAPPKPAPPAPKPQPIAPTADRIRDVDSWPLSKQGVLLVEHPRRPSYMFHKGFLLAADILAGKVVVYDGNGKDEGDVADASNLRQEQYNTPEALAQTGWEIA